MPIQIENPLWKNDHVQFARLLSEIYAVCPLEFGDLADSMDLSVDHIRELFDRAEKVWEEAKEEFCI